MSSTPVFQHAKSITSVCRLCFMDQKQMELIFKSDSGNLSEWIEKLTTLKITDVPEAPASLCSDCKSTLEAFDAFREMCITNDLVFKETFCRDNFQPKELTDVAVKVEYDEELQMEMDVKPSIKFEIVEEQDNIDVASRELLMDVYGTNVQDVYLNTVTDGKVENTMAEDEIKIEHYGMSCNSMIDGDEPTIEQSKVDGSAQGQQSVNVVLSDTFKYTCEICNASSSKLHILTHKKPELFQCLVCWKEFRRFNFVSQHIFKSHKDKIDRTNNKIGSTDESESEDQSECEFSSFQDGDFNCPVCKRTESEVHIKIHKAKGVFQCYICAKKFNRIVKCFKHINSHLRPPSSCSFCQICTKRVSRLHGKTHKAAGLYACQLCERKFKKFRSVKAHVERYHDEKDTHETIDAKEASSAESESSNTVENPFPLSNEEKILNQKYLVTCKICNKGVSKLHRKTHKAKALFACYFCTKMFKKFDYLSKHINQHKKGKKKMALDIQASDNKLQQHETDDNNQPQEATASPSEASHIIHQPIEVPSCSTAPNPVAQDKGNRGIVRSYECKICARYVTKLHAESHKAEGFQCPICLSHYVKFDHYSRHVRSHKEQGKYVCKICNKVLANAVSMARHEKLHKIDVQSS